MHNDIRQADLARHAGITRAAVKNAVYAGKLKQVDHDGMPFIVRSSAMAWLANRAAAAKMRK